MKLNTFPLIFALLSSCCTLWAAPGKAPDKETLWYTAPAPTPPMSLPWNPEANNKLRRDDVWERLTLPIGNGRVGATCYNGTQQDCMVLNEISLWTGGPNLPRNGAGYSFGPTSGKDQFGSYQPFAHLFVQYDVPEKTTNYRRMLSLKDATVTTEFNASGASYERRSFVSHPDNVIVYTASTTKSSGMTADIALLPFHNVSYELGTTAPGKSGNAASDTIIMKGTLANGEAFEGRAYVRVEGGSKATVTAMNGSKQLNVSYENNGGPEMRPIYVAEGVPYIRVSGATSFTIIISLATDYEMNYDAGWKGVDPATRNTKIMKAAVAKSTPALLQAHLANHRSLYNRLSINLGKTDADTAKLPTDKRLELYKERKKDPELEALLYQYGRYMLIAGSRPGNLPINLQGIWNNRVHAMWACDYHNNINLQMCYWGAEVGNLSECHMPFIDFIKVMEVPLHEMTQKQFGADKRGWTTRISQNPWGGGGWEKWNPPVNAWYALHVWDHYLFTQDKDYLRNVAYPIMKNICHFWEDSLKEIGEHGEGLVSDGRPVDVKKYPELAEIHAGALVSPNGWSHEWGPVEDGCMHDQQLVWELFDITAKAAGILHEDGEWVKGIEDKKNRLVGNRIGKGGYLQEWLIDRPNKVSGHRHTSHLIGVYPGSTISPARTPEFAKAAMKSLELRGVTDDNRRSWTWPWRTALWARFRDGEKAYEMVQSLLCYNILENMMATHRPMQLDGTYGITGGISEMLLQSHAGQLELLPALPAAWNTGSVRGLRARGNITVNMKWRDGKVTKLELFTTTPNPKPVPVWYNGKKTRITPKLIPADAK